MALNGYLRIVAAKQGPILGSVTQKGREGTIMVHAVTHQIVAPRDPVTGRPTGKRMHKPLIITKDLDRSTPALHDVLTRNENIVSWELRFYRSADVGAERHVYTVHLTNANISGVHFHMLNVRAPNTMRLPEHEDVAFTYQKIAWTWSEGGISAEDDWLTPR